MENCCEMTPEQARHGKRRGSMMKKTSVRSVLFSALTLLIWIYMPWEVHGAEPGGATQTCKMCHSDRFNSYTQSIHANKEIRNSPANAVGCESCHGPGQLHIQKGGGKGSDIFIFSKGKTDPTAKSEKCLACHAESRGMAFWDMSRHKTAAVSCDNCHGVHSGKKGNLKAPEPELCLSCHRDVRTQISKQSHHPLQEGRMKCTDCHDQHGSFGRKMIKTPSVNDLCYRCHAEMRGPFLWEHPPVEENCQTCHAVHGSNHGKLLTNRVPQLCQSCHAAAGHPGKAYTSQDTFRGAAPSNKMFARGCLNCHSNIHGSTGPSTRGQHFVR
jgi:DmsE family decaheme c-type cytochrome